MKIESLNELLAEELKDLYSAEKQLLKALPKMVKKACSSELKSALQEHLEVTERQVDRLEEVFELLGKPAKAKTCKAMQGLIEEGTEIMQEDAADAVMDAGIIAAAQKVEHYEIASYGTVRTWARLCGEEEAANLLQETLDEEGEADQRLTELAERIVNPEAEDGDGDYNQGAGSVRGGRGGKSAGARKSSAQKNSGSRSSGAKKSAVRSRGR